MDHKVLNLPLKALQLIGLHPDITRNSWMTYIKLAMGLAAPATLIIGALIQIYYAEWTIVSIAPLVETLIASAEVIQIIIVMV